MIQILQLKGKDKQLYQFLAPLVMDPDVIRANNNYPFKTNDKYVWFVAFEDEEDILGFVPVEQKSGKLAIINNYYVAAEEERRKEIMLKLLSSIVAVFSTEEKRILHSVVLKRDQGIFELFEFTSMDKNWTRYVKMQR